MDFKKRFFNLFTEGGEDNPEKLDYSAKNNWLLELISFTDSHAQIVHSEQKPGTTYKSTSGHLLLGKF